MPTVDRALQAYRRIWTLLLANADWTTAVKPGNRIRFDESDQSPQKRARQAGDFLEFELGLGGFTDDLDRAGATFCGSDEILDMNYIATVSTKATNISQLTLVALKTVEILRAAQKADMQKMGLSFMTFVGRIVAGRPRRTRLPDAPGEVRNVVEITIPVQLQFAAGTAPSE